MTLANQGRRLKPARPSGLPALILVTDDRRLPDPVAAAGRLPPGSGVLLRHYAAADRAGLARALAAVARRRRLVLLVAADWRLAAAVGADGVHLPEAQARSGRLAPLLGWARRRGRLVTSAAHSRAALAVARRLRLDAALLSPVFATASHPGAPGLGATRFRIWTGTAGVAVVALGGVTERSARALTGSASGLAAIGGW